MQYLALLIRQDRDLTPDERATEMAAYQSFHVKAGQAIRAGDALELARGIPAARYGAIEVRPIFHTVDAEWSR